METANVSNEINQAAKRARFYVDTENVKHQTRTRKLRVLGLFVLESVFLIFVKDK